MLATTRLNSCCDAACCRLQFIPMTCSMATALPGLFSNASIEQFPMRTLEREFHDLKIDPDGFVRLTFKYPNLARTEIPFELALQVTSSAVRRGPNVDFWSQREFCGTCGRDTLEQEVPQRFYETGRLEPMPPQSPTLVSAGRVPPLS